jgi:hypothetical protein
MTLEAFKAAVDAQFETVQPSVGDTLSDMYLWRRKDDLDNTLGIDNSEIDSHLAAWEAEMGTNFIKIDHDLYIKSQNV